MSNQRLFTVGSDVYEFSSEIREHYRDITTTKFTIAVWFDGTELCHRYQSEGSIHTERADVVEWFETYPTRAKQVLNEIGVKPLISPPTIDIEESSEKLRLRECA